MIHLEKIIPVFFDVFDDERTGLLSPFTFTLLLRVLGLRVNVPDVHSLIQSTTQQSKKRSRNEDIRSTLVEHTHDFSLDHHQSQENFVTLDLAIEVVKSQASNINLDIKEFFQILNPSDSGYICQDSLEKMISELYDDLENMQGENEDDVGFFSLPSVITKEDVSMMIDELDRDKDGKVSLSDFVYMIQRST